MAGDAVGRVVGRSGKCSITRRRTTENNDDGDDDDNDDTEDLDDDYGDVRDGGRPMREATAMLSATR